VSCSAYQRSESFFGTLPTSLLRMPFTAVPAWAKSGDRFALKSAGKLSVGSTMPLHFLTIRARVLAGDRPSSADSREGLPGQVSC